MMKRVFPHPILSVTLTVVWLALVNKVTLGNLLLGAFLGMVVPILTGPYWPRRPKIGRPLRVIEYIFIVLWDIVIANVQVALIVLFKPNSNIRSHWITIPLNITSPEAITVLAGTITMTPGTVSAMLSADSGSILVHCLHTDDAAGVRDTIKGRYEWRLKEIFQ